MESPQDILTKRIPRIWRRRNSLQISHLVAAMYEITNKNTGEKLYKTGDIMYNVNSSLYPEYLKEKRKVLSYQPIIKTPLTKS